MDTPHTAPRTAGELTGGHMFGAALKNRYSVSGDYVVVATNKTPVLMDSHVHARFMFAFGTATITIPDNGYAYFGSSKHLLHIWIAETFKGPRTAETVDHIDRVTTDNRLANLRWASQSLQNVNRGRVYRVATDLAEIAPGFTTVDLPRYIQYRPSAVEKTGATRGAFFAIEHGNVRRKTETRKELTLLDKYYQAICIADELGILRHACDLEPGGSELRAEAIALFRSHAESGGTAHPIVATLAPPAASMTALATAAAGGTPKRKRVENAPPRDVVVDGETYTVYAKAGVHVVCDKKNAAAIASVGDWSVEKSDGASVAIRQAIRTNKKTTLKGDLAARFPAMRAWATDKISLPEFSWRFCMLKEIPEGHSVVSLNKIPGDVREANLCLALMTGNRVPRLVVCAPPEGLDVPTLPLDLSVAYRKSEDRAFSDFSITGSLLKAADVVWRGSTSRSLSVVQKYDQAVAKLKEVYAILERDFDAEHAAYCRLVRENAAIVDVFDAM